MPDVNEVIRALRCCTKSWKQKNRENWGVEKEPYCQKCPKRHTGCCEYCLMRDALSLLEAMPKWVSVEKDKPKSMANKVIVYLEHDEYVSQIGYGHFEKYNGVEEWYNLETGEPFSKRGYRVTKWMPMPLSPEGSKLILS